MLWVVVWFTNRRLTICKHSCVRHISWAFPSAISGKQCLQIIIRLLWKQTTTHSIRNNNSMFDRQPPTQFFWATKYIQEAISIICFLWGQSSNSQELSTSKPPPRQQSIKTVAPVLSSTIPFIFAHCVLVPFLTLTGLPNLQYYLRTGCMKQVAFTI